MISKVGIKMIGIGVITHGKLAKGLKDSTRMIMGETENFEVLSLVEDTDLEEFNKEVFNLVTALNKNKGVLLFVDIFGATPFNTIAGIRENFIEKSIEVQIITGVNLPMLLESLAMRQALELSDLVPTITSAGEESIKSLEISEQ